jgi:steroid delta-isomerase-like uncharacterized protein
MELDTLARRWFHEVWNKGSVNAIEEMLTEETVHHGLSGLGDEIVKGVEGFKAFHAQMRAAFTDFNVEINEILAQDGRIAIRYEIRGLHTGEGLAIPVTKKPIRISGGGIARVKDGKFTEVFNLVDFFTMYCQLGAFPSIQGINYSQSNPDADSPE